MKRLTRKTKIEQLTNFLSMVTKNKSLYIKSDEINGTTFAIAERYEQDNLIRTRTDFMTYKEMHCFLYGVLAVQEKIVPF